MNGTVTIRNRRYRLNADATNDRLNDSTQRHGATWANVREHLTILVGDSAASELLSLDPPLQPAELMRLYTASWATERRTPAAPAANLSRAQRRALRRRLSR